MARSTGPTERTVAMRSQRQLQLQRRCVTFNTQFFKWIIFQFQLFPVDAGGRTQPANLLLPLPYLNNRLNLNYLPLTVNRCWNPVLRESKRPPTVPLRTETFSVIPCSPDRSADMWQWSQRPIFLDFADHYSDKFEPKRRYDSLVENASWSPSNWRNEGSVTFKIFSLLCFVTECKASPYSCRDASRASLIGSSSPSWDQTSIIGLPISRIFFWFRRSMEQPPENRIVELRAVQFQWAVVKPRAKIFPQVLEYRPWGTTDHNLSDSSVVIFPTEWVAPWISLTDRLEPSIAWGSASASPTSPPSGCRFSGRYIVRSLSDRVDELEALKGE